LAIYHLNMSIIQRSKGHSGVAAAAYRSGSRLVDERTGLVHDYRRKKDIIHSVILAPTGSPPPWVFDRQTLWSKAGAAGRRADSQEARQITLALPHELEFNDQVTLLSRFGRHLTSLGMVVDANLHSGGRSKRNVHGHLMAPMRNLTPVGFGQTNRAWNDRGLVDRLRLVWQDMVNEALMAAGSSERVSHCSLTAQGLLRAPTRHVGARVCALARQGKAWAISLKTQKQGRRHGLQSLRSNFLTDTIQALRTAPSESPLGESVGYESCAAVATFHPGERQPDSDGLAERRR